MRSRRFRLAVAGLFCLFGTALFVTGQSPAVRTQRAEANPAGVWVINQSVANFVNGTAVDFSTPAGRSAAASNLSSFQTASGGQIGPQPSLSGQVLVLVQTDGSNTGGVLNGRGLVCNLACDVATGAKPTTTDLFAAYTVT